MTTDSIPRVFIGALDAGTTSTRFIIFDDAGRPYATHQIEFGQHYPHAGWHEQDPYEIIKCASDCIDGAVKKFVADGYNVSDIKAVGITNQRESTVVWDSETGKPLYNAIAWPDTRTARLVHHFKNKKGAEDLVRICGLPLSTYPSALKLVWLLQNFHDVQEARERGSLMFGTVDTWLVYNLTGGGKPGTDTKFVTDTTNASRTMFLNINSLKYDDFLLDFFEVSQGVKLPEVVCSADNEAYGNIASGVLAGVPIASCLGDQSAALVGQRAFSVGMSKNTYGTGLFLLYNTGEEPVFSENGLLTTVGYHFKGEKPIYALEGSIAVGGAAVKFLRDNLGLISDSDEVGQLAAKVPDAGGVIFVTAFSGLFAPYWIDDARGTIYGITNYTTKEHIARATIEATCYQTRAVLEAMAKDSGHKLNTLKVDGGMSNSDVCMQIQSDIIGIDVVRPEYRETTALGAAFAAGFAVGVYSSFEELKQVNTDGETTFKPSTTFRKREKLYNLWQRAVSRCGGWFLDEDDDSEVEEETRVGDGIRKQFA
ncbi:uncharacterized protein V1513DRAFT_399010 [Lipomyces chichibuensis]|uniref:uncharacterized protein n=1 Tax=Lipomyces chichibuensis TaxID=1546026 RepID=UPI003343BD1F